MTESEALRTCPDCGKQAFDEAGLKHFIISKSAKYGRQNICRRCRGRRTRARRSGVPYVSLQQSA